VTTKRVAAIDCGTNSIRLLIADLTSTPAHSERIVGSSGGPQQSPLADVTRQMRIVRLGEGVDRTGRLAAAALDRTMTALREYANLIDDAQPEAVRMVATSATRDAANAQEFTDRVVEILGVAPEVISGDEEAMLSFTGATRELAGTPLATACLPPYLVTDIGGGSTEFVLGGADASQVPHGQVPHGQIPRGQIQGRSVNIGCVRLTERHLHGDPPLAAEVAATVADIDAALDQVAVAVPVARARTLVGLAGSVTTVAAIALGQTEYDSARIHHSRISAAQVHGIADDLLAMTRAERAAIPVMHPGRIDVIGAGALILDRIVTRFGFAEVLVSEHDILDGIAWSLLP
jgi:exopolyphosphatase/guanosine-5'-triphosphate,3'-diphosphate pyrophosphatase